MIITTINSLLKVGNSKYARVCESENTTYLDAPGYEITFINGADYEDNIYGCKGWDCPVTNGLVTGLGETKCGVSHHSSDIAHLIRIKYATTLSYDTSCKNYENAYRVNRTGEEGYIIGCPNGLELYTAPVPTTSPSSFSSSLASTLVTPTPANSALMTSAPVIDPTSSTNLMGYTTDIISEPSSSILLNSSSSSNSSSLSQTTSSSVSSQTTANAPITTSESSVVSSSGIATESSISTLSSSSKYLDEISEEFSLPTLTIEPTSSEVLPVESSALESEVSSQMTQQSNEVVDLGKAGAQLGAGAIVGIVFASIAGFTILTVLMGVVGFVLLNLSSKGSAGSYSFSKTTRTDNA